MISRELDKFLDLGSLTNNLNIFVFSLPHTNDNKGQNVHQNVALINKREQEMHAFY